MNLSSNVLQIDIDSEIHFLHISSLLFCEGEDESQVWFADDDDGVESFELGESNIDFNFFKYSP